MSIFFYIFVYLYYPMKFERKFLKGPPLLAPPPVLKNQAPPAEKKLDPLPWAFGARPRMICHQQDIGEKSGQVKLGVGPAGTPQDPKEALLSQGKNLHTHTLSLSRG